MRQLVLTLLCVVLVHVAAQCVLDQSLQLLLPSLVASSVLAVLAALHLDTAVLYRASLIELSLSVAHILEQVQCAHIQ